MTDAYIKLGEQHRRMGLYQKAIEHFDIALECDEDLEEAIESKEKAAKYLR